MYSAKIVADSLAPSGKRLTTMEVCFPRIILAEFNTHRQFSRNSASSRAIPVEKMIQRVMDDPFIPERFPVNEKGMQASAFFEGADANSVKGAWLFARDKAVECAKNLLAFGVHKQIANRLLEPFLWHTVIVTATEWSNFFAQRCHPDAQPEIQAVAYMMQDLLVKNEPACLQAGEYHLPLVQSDETDLTTEQKIKLSVARCARVSYLTHEGKRDHEADYALFDRLCQGMHMSPLEHVAYAMGRPYSSGNFIGWHQFRKDLANECR